MVHSDTAWRGDNGTVSLIAVVRSLFFSLKIMIEPDLFDLPQEPRKELASLGKVIDVLFKKMLAIHPKK